MLYVISIFYFGFQRPDRAGRQLVCYHRNHILLFLNYNRSNKFILCFVRRFKSIFSSFCYYYSKIEDVFSVGCFSIFVQMMFDCWIFIQLSSHKNQPDFPYSNSLARFNMQGNISLILLRSLKNRIHLFQAIDISIYMK